MVKPRIFLSPPHLSGQELQQAADVLNSNWVAPVGPALDEFERRMAATVGVGHAVALSSGTAALHLALKRFALQGDDEVICSTLTFCASANPIFYEGARPVFLDSDLASWNLDPQLLEEELAACAQRGRLPRAIVVVDVFGQSADIDAIESLARRYEIPVIEDAAEALGAQYKGSPVGARSWASFFSFNGNKIITTGGGGMLCSNDAPLISQARHLAAQARDPAPHYEHSTIGYNYRLSNVLAGIGLAQLDVLNERVDARRAIFDGYAAALGDLPGVSFMPEAEFGRSSRWLTVMLIDERRFGCSPQEVLQTLEQANIEARPVWKPLHLQPVFQGCRSRGGDVAEQLFRQGLCLPSGSAMTQHDLQRVAQVVKNCYAPRGRRGRGRQVAATAASGRTT